MDIGNKTNKENSNFKELNDLKIKNNDLKTENNRLKSEISNLNKKVLNLDKTIKDLNDKNLELNNTIEILNNTITNLKKEENDYKCAINQVYTQNADLLKKIKEMEEKEKNKIENKREEMLISLMKKLEVKENEIKMMKEVLPFDLKAGETLLPLIFVTSDQKVHYSLICKDSEKFNSVENRLYEVYPQYEEEENYFTANGIKITKSKTLKENGIKYSNIILMIPIEN